MVGLPDGENTLEICITVYTQYRCVTDRHLYMAQSALCICIAQ